jgi:propanol-preferring alcohol dehydrogenase
MPTVMRAMVFDRPAPIETNPLALVERPVPVPGAGELLVRVKTCGVCRTDLHLTEGDLAPKSPRVVPGHEIVGIVAALGPNCTHYATGAKVGVAWLRETDGTCKFCRSGRENLCLAARFTGWDHDGGFADFVTVRENFAYALPEELDDEHAAPLMCAGIIGYRSIERAGIAPGMCVGLYGFGGSAHLAIQVLRHWNCRVFVMSRAGIHRDLAAELGAEWLGDTYDRPPEALDAAILFAPDGDIVLPAMEALDRGGILAIAGIYLTPVPVLDYQRDLFNEREIRSVTANTRHDGREFLRIAGEIDIRPRTIEMPLEDANRALQQLKHDELSGAAVLRLS